MPKASPPRARVRVPILVAVLLAFGLLASGCVRVHAAFAVSSDDRVSGDLVVAALPSAQNDKGPPLTVSPQLAGRVTSKPYAADGYVGTELTFDSLTFDEVAELATTVSTSGGDYHLAFQRSGDLVTLAGSVDLTRLPPDRVDVQLKVNFPGTVVRTDGDLTDQTVSWQLKPGRVSSFSAAAQYTIGNTRGWQFWSLVLGGGGGLIAVFILGLALLARRRQLRKERAPA